MRYKLDINGYVCLVLWGSNSGDCQEYTGEIPAGYTSLVSWAENAVINAYYIDSNGNLVLDAQREKELKTLAERQAIDYSPVLRRDLYETQEVLDSQYIKVMSSAVSKKILALENVKNIPPYVKLKNLSSADTITFFAQTKNMLKNDAVTETINGVSFTRNPDGQIVISGTATADVEYNLSGGSGNTTPIFALLTDVSYYLRIGSLSCEMRYFNGETTEQVYSGSTSSAITPAADKKVTQVVIKIPSGTAVDKSFYPTLSDSATEIDYEEYKCKLLTFDVGTITDSDAYIKIENGLIILYESEEESLLGQGNTALLDGDQIVYTDQGNLITIKYSINKLAVEDLGFLQGKATTTNKFKILEDGSIEAHNGNFSGTITGSTIANQNDEATSKVELNLGDITLTEKYGSYDIITKLMGSGLRMQSSNPNNQWTISFWPTGVFSLVGPDGIGGEAEINLSTMGVMNFKNGDKNVQLSPDMDIVIEHGTSGIWTYEKWNSGKAVCWGTKTGNLSRISTYFNFHLYAFTDVAFPSSLFIEPPKAFPKMRIGTSGGGTIDIRYNGDSTITKDKMNVYGISETNTANQPCKADIFAIGRWK